MESVLARQPYCVLALCERIEADAAPAVAATSVFWKTVVTCSAMQTIVALLNTEALGVICRWADTQVSLRLLWHFPYKWLSQVVQRTAKLWWFMSWMASQRGAPSEAKEHRNVEATKSDRAKSTDLRQERHSITRLDDDTRGPHSPRLPPRGRLEDVVMPCASAV
jgi:hypothetical protein